MKLRSMCIALASAALLSMNVPSAHASTTLSVGGSTAPGAVQGLGSLLGSFYFESDYAIDGDCSSGNILVEFDRGATLSTGAKIGSVKGIGISNCSLTALGFTATMVPLTYPFSWEVRLLDTPTSGQTHVPVEIRGISLLMHTPGVPIGSWTTAALLTGTLPATLNTLSDTLEFDTSHVLYTEALNSSGNNPPTANSTMGGEIWDGDLFRVQSTFSLGVDVAVS